MLANLFQSEWLIALGGFLFGVLVNVATVAFFFGNLSERVKGLRRDVDELKQVHPRRSLGV